MKYYLGLDNGGTVTKAGLYTQGGEEVAVESVKTDVFSVKPGFAERDMNEMRDANYKVIRHLLEKTGIDSADVAGLACCGHGKGLYLWGRDGKPVRPGIISTDNRAWEYPVNWKRDGTVEKVYEKTFQDILAFQPVSLLAWMKDNEEELIKNIEWIFECKDFVRFCLTGEAYAEITDYSGANLINLITREYDTELMELFGLGDLMDALPPIRKSTDICGRITAEAAELTGLTEGTPVMGGMFDINACALAVDVTSEEKVCMIAGTWSINEYIRKEPVTDGSVLMNSIFCIPEYYLIEESSPTSAGNFEWFIKNLLPEVSDQMYFIGKNVYDIVNGWVDEIPVIEFCPIFFPFLMASNVHPNGKSAFIGLTGFHTRGHMAKGIYEGIAFSHRYHLDKLLKSRTAPVETIRLAGGVANSPQWIQIFADVMNYPIELVDINETGTLGCAMNVAVSLGDYSDFSEAAENMITIKDAVLPIPANVEIYEKRYALYKQLLEALDPVWADIQKLMDEG